MKIYSWNINGIRAVHKKGLLQDFLEKHNPDILCLQEIKANQEQIDFTVDGYETYWCSAERKGYSGTAVFSKTPALNVTCGFPVEIVSQYEISDIFGDASTEGRVITVEFTDYFVVSVYVPNAKDSLGRLPLRQEWDKALLAYLQQLELKKPVICGGDFNVAHMEQDLARPKPNIGKKGFTLEERSGFTNFMENGFLDTFRVLHPHETSVYTWWSHFGKARERNVGWRIDYFIISASLKSRLKTAAVHPEVLGSDHCPVSVTVK